MVMKNKHHFVFRLSQGKDEVYDRMLLDYFLSYHQFIHLLCRVAINCEKFTDTLVKLSQFPVCLSKSVCVFKEEELTLCVCVCVIQVC